MNRFLPILSFDTAAQQCGVALFGDGLALELIEPQRQGQSERLLPMIEEILHQAGLGFTDLAAIAVTTGPGSFTGLRLALAAAHGVGLAQGIPVVGIDSFQAFNAGLPNMDADRLVVIESRRAELYWCRLTLAGTRLGEPAMNLPQEIATTTLAATTQKDPLILCGDGGYHLAEKMTGALFVDQRPGPSPLALARLGKAMLGENIPAIPPAPFYIRPPDAKLPTGKR